MRWMEFYIWFILCLSAGDDLKVSVNMRGGPERNQITGWLQIMEMEKKHEGDYTCIAQNELGVVQASARVNVIEDEGS